MGPVFFSQPELLAPQVIISALAFLVFMTLGGIELGSNIRIRAWLVMPLFVIGYGALFLLRDGDFRPDQHWFMMSPLGWIAGALAFGDTVIQKAITGEVNWGQVAVSGAFDTVGGAGIAAMAGRQVAGNAVEGAVENVAYTAASGQPLTPGSLVRTAAEGATVSTVTGGTMNRVPGSSGRLDVVSPTPDP